MKYISESGLQLPVVRVTLSRLYTFSNFSILVNEISKAGDEFYDACLLQDVEVLERVRIRMLESINRRRVGS